MILEKLQVDRQSYGPNKGKLAGRIRFADSERGAVEIVLDDAKCKSILLVCATQLVDTAKLVARDLTTDCIDGQALLARESA